MYAVSNAMWVSVFIVLVTTSISVNLWIIWRSQGFKKAYKVLLTLPHAMSILCMTCGCFIVMGDLASDVNAFIGFTCPGVAFWIAVVATVVTAFCEIAVKKNE